jgi:hypothetical protein
MGFLFLGFLSLLSFEVDARDIRAEPCLAPSAPSVLLALFVAIENTYTCMDNELYRLCYN